MKVKETDNGYYTFFCPGCKRCHGVRVGAPHRKEDCWTFNGNVDQPTFSPSLLVTCGHYVPGQKQPPDCQYCNEGCNSCYQCHSFINNGFIQFLGDCTHELANQTIEIPDIESIREKD